MIGLKFGNVDLALVLRRLQRRYLVGREVEKIHFREKPDLPGREQVKGLPYQFDVAVRLEGRQRIAPFVRVFLETTLEAALGVFLEQPAMSQIRHLPPDFVLGILVAQEREEFRVGLLPPADGILTQDSVAAKTLTQRLRD